MKQGSMKRAAVLAATMALFAALAQSAQAASWTPVIKGAGSVTHAGYTCNFSVPGAADPTNATSTSCPPAPLDTNYNFCSLPWSGGCLQYTYVSATTVNAVPAPGWAFVGWDGCTGASANNGCDLSAALPIDLPVLSSPVATFREIVAIAGSGNAADFAASPDFSNVKRPRVEFSTAVPASAYRCQVANSAGAIVQAKATCTSPFAPSADLPDGHYTYTVWASHNNDESITPFTKAFAVDTVKPATSLDVLTGPQEGSLLTIHTATFSFASSEPGTFQCSLDGADFAACASPLDYSGLAGGAHTFQVRSVDRAGNVEAVAKQRSWTIFEPPATPPAQQVIVTGSSDPQQIAALLSYGFAAKGSSTRLKSLALKNVPFGSTVTVTCLAGKCPAALYRTVKSGKNDEARRAAARDHEGVRHGQLEEADREAAEGRHRAPVPGRQAGGDRRRQAPDDPQGQGAADHDEVPAARREARRLLLSLPQSIARR